MIDKSRRFYNLVCDVCGGKANKTFSEFYEALEYKKDSDWKWQKQKNGQWEDVCPNCQEAK